MPQLSSGTFLVLLVILIVIHNFTHWRNLEGRVTAGIIIRNNNIDIDAPLYYQDNNNNWKDDVNDWKDDVKDSKDDVNEDDSKDELSSDEETIEDLPEETIEDLSEEDTKDLSESDEETIEDLPKEDTKDLPEEDTKKSAEKGIKESAEKDSKELPEEDSENPSEEDSSINNSTEKDFYIDEPISESHWSKGIIGSPESTIISIDDCQCELVSIDCLEMIKCMNQQMNQNKDQLQQRVYAGIVRRQTIKKMATYWQTSFSGSASWVPLGRSFQTTSQALFREWMKRNQLPPQLSNNDFAAVNISSFEFCIENGLKGRNCIVDKLSEREQLGVFEEEAFNRYDNGTTSTLDDDRMENEKELRLFWRNRFDTTPVEYLLMFSHMARIALNIRRHILDLYRQRVQTISSSGIVDFTNDTFRVAMHVRRGDSCGHKLGGYAQEASPLDSRAQISSVRMCYDTAVYMKALQRVLALAEGRHLVVYVATDHLLDLMDDIQKNHQQMYKRATWKIVQHPREIFNYSHTLRGGEQFIEFSENHAALGETAIMDLWHLSHGQAFIGHLGSRFGKLSWWEAMARHNSFVPFFTVDGHSVCCDIDEACGKIAPSIVSMENCLTFSRDQTKYQIDKKRYWSEGSFVRFQFAKDEIEFRKRRDRNYQSPARYNSTY